MDIAIPVLRPDAILGSWSRFPRKHGPVKANAELFTEFPKNPLRITQQFAGIKHQGVLPDSLEPGEELMLFTDTDIIHARASDDLRKRRYELLRVSNQEHVPHTPEKSFVDINQVMGHVFDEKRASLQVFK
jgi:hypothetical protein